MPDSEWTVATLKQLYDRERAETNRRLDEIVSAVAQGLDQDWKTAVDRALSETVKRPEFQLYRDTTAATLTLAAGRSQGIGISVGAIVQVIATLAAVATVIGVLLMGRHG